MLRFILVIFTLLFFTSCSLLNSGTVHMKYTKFKADVDGVTYENKRGLGNVSVSVRNIQHPKKFGRWNINMKIRPSIHFERHPLGTLATRLNTDTGEQEQIPDFTFRRLSGFANLKLSLHTPIGAFAATVGYGGAVRDFDRPSDRDIRTTEIRKVDFVYYAFLGKRFFVLLGPRYYKEEFEQVTFALRFGYFWGKS